MCVGCVGGWICILFHSTHLDVCVLISVEQHSLKWSVVYFRSTRTHTTWCSSVNTCIPTCNLSLEFQLASKLVNRLSQVTA